MALPDPITFKITYSLVDAATSDDSTAEFPTLASKVRAPDMLSAVQMINDQRYVHWVPTALAMVVERPAAPSIILEPE